uniref:Leucine rich immune protein (Short) n=1 Tax=Anopheles atroparvus TaxID=41427 RepID=A0A182ITB9_ANOAO
MCRPIEMLPVSLLVLAAIVLPALAAPGQPKQYKCTVVNEDGFCFVENVLLDVTANGGVDPKVQFPQHPTVLIKSGSIPYFGKDIFALLGGTRQLHVYNNTCIKRLFIPATNLSEINVQRNGLTELEIDAVENRELRMLSIVHNAIVSVPRNLRFLVGLEKLYLYNNSIESLDLDLLANASGTLKILSIYDNRIKTLDSRAGLQFPKLQTLSMSKNKLTFVPYFLEAFPALSVVSLRKNPWSCHWLRTIVPHIESRKIQVVRKDATCRDRWVSEICCLHSLVDYLFDWHSDQLHRERETVRNLSTDNRRLLETVNQLSGDVHQLQLQFQQLQPQNAIGTSVTDDP